MMTNAPHCAGSNRGTPIRGLHHAKGKPRIDREGAPLYIRLMRKLCPALFLFFALNAFASEPGFELIYTAPAETTLQQPTLRDTAGVWPQVFDSAQQRIDLAQMYAADEAGEALEPSMAALERAGARGVKIRFLIEKKMLRASSEKTLARLRAIPNLELKELDFGALGTGGIHHAKYFVIDGGRAAFIGSQNFDWRALKHIHELGVKIADPKICSQLATLFERDWKGKELTQGLKLAIALQKKKPTTAAWTSPVLLASPWALNPAGIPDSESELVQLIGSATQELRIQVMDYYPLNHKKTAFYPVIDNAIRAAAVRGVKVKLLVSNWGVEKDAIEHIKSLSLIPNIEIRVVSIPEASSGFIPFSRVIHSKYMVVDGKTLWIGTSNWTGGYLDDSRNVELILPDEKLAAQGTAIHEQLWISEYASPIDLSKKYETPRRF